MIRDSLGLVAAALASQTDWKLTLTPAGTWVMKKQLRRPAEPSVDAGTVAFETPDMATDPQGDSLYLFV